MAVLPASILLIVFLCLSGIHVYWAFGGTFWLDGVIPTQGGKPLFKPGVLATLLVAVALLGAGALVVWKGFFPATKPLWLPSLGVWSLAVVFAFRAIGDFRYAGLFKKFRETKFARNDSLIFTPLCILISALSLWLSL